MSSRAVKKADDIQFMLDYPIALVRALRDAGIGQNRKDGEPFPFVCLSSVNELTDPTDKSSGISAIVKFHIIRRVCPLLCRNVRFSRDEQKRILLRLVKKIPV